MQAEIVTIGDEILIGQIIDSNSAFIAKELNKIGISVYQITSVQDERQHILQVLEEANSRSEIIILTGGLGPTKDDVTKHTLCEFLNDELVLDQATLDHVEFLFKKYISTPISDLNRKQALVPKKASVLKNENGTAPGLWMPRNGSVFISLPGVPFEMRNLMADQVIPRLVKKYDRPHILHRTVMTYGLGESAIAEKIEDWEDNLPNFVRLAYLPNLGRVRLRLTAKGPNREVLEKTVDEQIEGLYPLIGDIIYGIEEDESIEALVAKMLTQRKMTLATAESFTGGSIAERITALPGASAYFKGTIVSYATETKIKLLGVDPNIVKKHSVVSEAVAVAMAQQVQKLVGADFAIATTGNAGPAKGDSNADVGTVYIAIATPKHTFAKKFVMGNHRERIVQKSVNKAFELLQKEILNF